MAQKRLKPELLAFDNLDQESRARIGAMAGQLVALVPELKFDDALEILAKIGIVMQLCGEDTNARLLRDLPPGTL